MLQPKRLKFRKVQKGRNRGIEEVRAKAKQPQSAPSKKKGSR